MHFFLLFENLWHEVSFVVIAEYIFLSILDPFSFKVGSPCMKCIIRVCTHWLKTTHIFPSINLHKCIVEFAENANRKFFCAIIVFERRDSCIFSVLQLPLYYPWQFEISQSHHLSFVSLLNYCKIEIICCVRVDEVDINSDYWCTNF